jgi:hypothetical protein
MSRLPDIEFMRELERDFVQNRMGGTNDPARYKIYYSGIGRSPAIFLGINPAGSAENFLNARQPYEEWGHDFLEYEFDPNYKLARGAVRFLRRLVDALSTEKNDDIVRQIPVSNVCFIRSQNPKNLVEADYVGCAPYVRRIVEKVDPIVAVTVGEVAFERLKNILGSNVSIQINAGREVRTANGNNRPVLYQSYSVKSDNSRLKLILRLGHLSKFGLGRDADWSSVYSHLDRDLAEVSLRPFVIN